MISISWKLAERAVLVAWVARPGVLFDRAE